MNSKMSSINIDVINDEEKFLELESDWNRLSQGMIAINSFEWMQNWWKNFKKSNELNILIARQNGKIAGIAPLYIDNGVALKILKFKKLCFLGGDISDYQDFLIEDNDHRETVFKALFEYIINNISYDLLELKQISSFYPNFDLWQKYAGTVDAKFSSIMECHKVQLSGFSTYQDYYNQLGTSHKDHIRKGQNRANKDFKKVEYIFKQDISKEDIDDIADLNIQRQKDKFEQGDEKRFCYFLDNAKSSFIKDFFCESPTKGKMLSILKFGDEIVTYHLMLPWGNTLSMWNTAFNAKYHKYNPAKLLINEIIKYAFDNNYVTVDFLRGKDPHKLKWTNDFSENYILERKKTLKAKLIFFYRENIPDFLKKKYSYADICSNEKEAADID